MLTDTPDRFEMTCSETMKDYLKQPSVLLVTSPPASDGMIQDHRSMEQALVTFGVGKKISSTKELNSLFMEETLLKEVMSLDLESCSSLVVYVGGYIDEDGMVKLSGVNRFNFTMFVNEVAKIDKLRNKPKVFFFALRSQDNKASSTACFVARGFPPADTFIYYNLTEEDSNTCKQGSKSVVNLANSIGSLGQTHSIFEVTTFSANCKDDEEPSSGQGPVTWSSFNRPLTQFGKFVCLFVCFCSMYIHKCELKSFTNLFLGLLQIDEVF